MTALRPRVGVSACLLGEAVRYDGGHKRDAYLVGGLGAHVEWVSVCPEVELGLGTPRPPIRLEGAADDPRLVVTATGSDLTGRMARWAADRGAELREQGLSGFVLKSRSPSCGLGDAPIVDESGVLQGTRSGEFANDLEISWPGLPLASDVSLADPARRASFLSRVFAHASLAQLSGQEALRRHHERHRLLIACFELDALARLDELVATGNAVIYGEQSRAALTPAPSRDAHVRALRYACMRAGQRLTTAGREQVATALDAYTAGSISLATVIRAVRGALPDIDPEDAYLHPPPPLWAAYREI